MNAIEFARRHVGLLLTASTDPLAWTVCYGIANKSKKRTRFGPGTAVLISEAGAVFAGVTPEVLNPEAPVSVTPMTAAELKWHAVFSPPDGPWIGLAFGKLGVTAESLVLNLSRHESVFAEDSGKKLVRVRAGVLEEARELIGDRSASEIRRGMDLWRDKRSGKLMREKALGDFSKIVAGSTLPKAFALLERHEQTLGLYFSYLKYLEASQ